MSGKPHIKLSASQLWGGQGAGLQLQAAAHTAADTTDKLMRNWLPPRGSADADLLPDLPTIVGRTRDLTRNNGLGAGYVQTAKDNIIGAVLRLSAKPDRRALGMSIDEAQEWAGITETEFRSWTDTPECDAANTCTLLGLSNQALGGATQNGDHLAIPIWEPRPGSRWSTRLMLIEGDRLETPPAMEHLPNMRGGVEINKHGAPLAYWFRKTHPGDRLGFHLRAASIGEYERVPAFTPWGRRRVIHLHDKERTGQSRGKPLFAAVLREFMLAGKYESHELQTAAANSLISAFIESNLAGEDLAALFGAGQTNPDGTAVNPEQYWRQVNDEYGNAKLQSTAMIPLPVGAKVTPFVPGRPNNAFEAFMVTVLRHLAAGLNIPYELLAKDFSKTNYSSARAALLEAWRYFTGRRRWLRDYWLNPIYELWLEEAVDLGRVRAPGFYEHKAAWCRASWIMSGRGWVDPVKEAKAAAMRMEAGVSTLEAECAEQGLDWEEVIEQQARENKARLAAGLQPIKGTLIGPTEAAPQTEEAAA